MGIEPTPSAWKAEVLPLNYTRRASRPVPVEAYASHSPDMVEALGLEATKAYACRVTVCSRCPLGYPSADGEPRIFNWPREHVNVEVAMEQRRLGGEGLTVSALGLGGVAGPGAYSGGGDAAEAEATLLAAVDTGITLFDTAEVYGPFTNERMVGRLLKGERRDRVILATKFRFRISADGQISGRDSRPDHIREVVEASLERLGTDRTELLYHHPAGPAAPAGGRG